MGRRSLNVSTVELPHPPSAHRIQQFASAILAPRHIQQECPGHTPHLDFFLSHRGDRISGEHQWTAILEETSEQPTLHLNMEQFEAEWLTHARPDVGKPVREGLETERPLHSDFFVVRINGQATVYLEEQKMLFDSRMRDFAREGLPIGTCVLFPPRYEDEYRQMFEDHGKAVGLTTESTEIAKPWHVKVATIAATILAGAVSGTVYSALAHHVSDVAACRAGGAVAGTAASPEPWMWAQQVGEASVATFAGTLTAGLAYLCLKVWLPKLSREKYAILFHKCHGELGMLPCRLPGDSGVCEICFDKDINAAYVPCGHTGCHGCLEENLQRVGQFCHVCRHPATLVQRIFIDWRA
eukprot:CAMPEP_0115514926 /NCGR_PEP_ID=MMETSP0271-20121206/75927_1 /TAXON_ID=71861 /ORGANISM="Scrippsiella trochoidea, Strain CCMP3099" /LENGTH=353 /DNA_ID=CAMNT_0002945431 /DNA_START=1 /DNA_END=1062 /DNA_ORIENTATION=+